MAIDKNDYLDVNGDYDLKKSLIDDLIDEINSITTTETDTPTNVLSGFDLSNLRVTKTNNVVTIFGRIQGDITPSFQQVFTIGVGFRIPTTQTIIAEWASFSEGTLTQIQLSSNGTVYIRSQSNIDSTYINVSYIVE